jgi:hypothetical protein
VVHFIPVQANDRRSPGETLAVRRQQATVEPDPAPFHLDPSALAKDVETLPARSSVASKELLDRRGVVANEAKQLARQ